MTLISVEAIAFSYGRKPVLHDVSFTVKKGINLGLVGGSGSGKSTILKLCSALSVQPAALSASRARR